jgi:hypothetical protein
LGVVLGFGGNLKSLAGAWLGSSVAFAVSFVAWAVAKAWLEASVQLQPLGMLRLAMLGFGASLVFQLTYGLLVYVALSRIGLWRFWTVAAAYLLPVALFSWAASDTTQDIIGTIPWLALAVIVAIVTWLLVATSAVAR